MTPAHTNANSAQSILFRAKITSRLLVLLLGLGVLSILYSVQPVPAELNSDVGRMLSSFPDKERSQGRSRSRAADVLQTHFPQTQRCNYDKWGEEYARMHAAIVTGRTAPRYLVSVAVYQGLADRMTGIATQFYLALLSGRALTMVTHSHLPPFEAACAQPYVNWTHPQALPQDALSPEFVTNFIASQDFEQPLLQLPEHGAVNSSTYFRHSLMNSMTTPVWLASSNLSLYPFHNPGIPYVLSVSNRGDTYAVMNNPYHKQQWLSRYGLTDETAFMCSWFYLCSPNGAVQDLYLRTWSILSDAKVLKIGIKVRLGDSVFLDQRNVSLGEEQLKEAAPYFECAERLQQAFARPGQKVVWYLISDALPLRISAAKRFAHDPDKLLLTDTRTVVWHTHCHEHNEEACSKETMELTTQHALGEMLAFSMADYHITPKDSGFGRVGGWLSGKSNNLFEFNLEPGLNLSAVCDPKRPTPPQVSANSWSRI